MLFLFPASDQFIGKHISPTGPAPRANVFWWHAAKRKPCGTLAELVESLTWAGAGIYVHGGLPDELVGDKRMTRRMFNSPFNTPDRPDEVGHIEDDAITTFCLDFDGSARDPILPPFLQDIGHVRQWTSRDDPAGELRYFRLWFLLSPHSRQTIRRDLLHAFDWSTIPGLDVSPWAAGCHPVFLSAPVFVDGAVDPHAGKPRWEVVEGLLGDFVDITQIPEWVPPVRVAGQAKGTAGEIQALCQDVLGQRAKNGRHAHALNCVRDLVYVGADDDLILATITELFQVQGREPGPQEIDRMIKSARAKESTGELYGPTLTSKMLAGVRGVAQSFVQRAEPGSDVTSMPPVSAPTESTPTPPSKSDVSAVILGKNDTADARTYLALYYPTGGLVRMYRSFYEWNNGKYSVLSDEEMESRIQFKCGHLPQKKIKGILSAVKSYVQVYHLPKVMPPQFEIGEGVGHRKEFVRPLPDLIIFKNGMLNIKEWLANSKTVTLAPLTPNVFCQSALPYAFDPTATAPTLNKFLAESLPSADQQRLARKMMGAVLLAENRFQVIFVLVGPPGSGKSTFAKVMRSVVGVEALASATMQSVSSEFGTFPLLSARIILMPEANSTEGHGVAITSKIKAWSGEDPIPFCAKFATGFTAQMPGRILLVANEVPTFPDASGAILRRISALQFDVSFVGAEDRDLSAKIEAEMPGVMNEALRGLRILLQEDQGFTKKTEAETVILEEYRDEVMPILAFLKECCQAADAATPAKDLFQGYRRWCEATGRKFPCQQNTFTRRIEPALHSLKMKAKRHRVATGTAFEGLTWSENGKAFAPAFSPT